MLHVAATKAGRAILRRRESFDCILKDIMSLFGGGLDSDLWDLGLRAEKEFI